MNARQRYRALRAANHRKAVEAQGRFERKIEEVMSGCSERVSRAAYGTLSLRDRKPKAEAICMPDVAIYSAGHRTKSDRVTCTGRQKVRGRSIPLV